MGEGQLCSAGIIYCPDYLRVAHYPLHSTSLHITVLYGIESNRIDTDPDPRMQNHVYSDPDPDQAWPSHSQSFLKINIFFKNLFEHLNILCELGNHIYLFSFVNFSTNTDIADKEIL